jgi:hypothetical protein
VGGSDLRGKTRTVLVKPYNDGNTIFVESADGFHTGDFVYLNETKQPYSYGNYGNPHWPVDDVLYRGWGKIKSVDRKTGAITMWPYRYGIPNSPAGVPVIRSDHANDQAFEFMDAEYNQWPMYGEGVANAGPFYMQHGAWRIEVEPIEKETADLFLHVMLACDNETLVESRAALTHNIKLSRDKHLISLEIEGSKRTYELKFDAGSSDARVTAKESGKIILDHPLTPEAIKARTKTFAILQPNDKE